MFAVYELLELIILALPSKDALVVQRVSRSWKAIIDRSTRLQKALCLLPTKRLPFTFQELGTLRRRYPKLLEWPSAVAFYADTLNEDFRTNPLDGDAEAPVRPLINPILQALCPPDDDRALRQHTFQYPKYLRNACADGKNSSLKRMLVTQPPLPVFIICCDKTCVPNTNVFGGNLETRIGGMNYIANENGVTIADVLEFLENSIIFDDDAFYPFTVTGCEEGASDWQLKVWGKRNLWLSERRLAEG